MSVTHLSVGGVTPSGAMVKAKTTSGLNARLAVSTSPALSSPTFFGPVAPSSNIVTLSATGLTANTQYYYGIEDNGVLDTTTTGKFKTFPTAGSSASFTCVVASCAGTSASADLIATGVSNRAVFDTIRNRAPLFLAHQGDRSYVNRSTNDVTGFRTDYDLVMSASRQHHLYRDVPTVYVWDDHDFGDNDCDTTAPSKPAVSQVFRERIPRYTLPDASTTGAIYHSFEVGRILFIVADTRHDKSPSANVDNSSKTLLGAAQKTWMNGILTSSTAKALVWLNGTPWMGLAGDTWNGYHTEQAELITLFTTTGWIDRMVCVDGDNHQLAMDTGGGNLSMTGASWPVWTFGSMDSPSSGVSTQYDMGPSSPGIDRYGTIEVVDTGGDEITITGTGYISSTPWRTFTLTVPVGGAPVTPPRSVAMLYDETLSRVRLQASGLTFGTDHIDLDRSTNQRLWTPVRGGVGAPVKTAQSTSAALNANPYFETNATGYVMSSGDTIARSTAQFHQGAASGLLTSDGSGASMTCSTDTATSPAAVVGASYTATAWVRSPIAWAAGAWVSLVWIDVSNAVIGLSTGTTTALVANTWQQLSIVGGAPLGAVRVGLRVALLGTPAAAATLFIDECAVTNEIVDNTASIDDYEFGADVPNYYRIRSRDVAGSLLEEFVEITTPVLDGVWLKNLSRPFLNRKVDFLGEEEPEVLSPSRAGVFDIVGRTYPVAVTDVRSSRRLELVARLETVPESKEFRLILAAGDPVFLHVPAEHCVLETMYAVIGDTTWRRQSAANTIRLHRLPLVEVAAPGPDIVGVTINWQGIFNTFDTWQDLIDAQASWATTLELIGTPEDVIVS